MRSAGRLGHVGTIVGLLLADPAAGQQLAPEQRLRLTPLQQRIRHRFSLLCLGVLLVAASGCNIIDLDNLGLFGPIPLDCDRLVNEPLRVEVADELLVGDTREASVIPVLPSECAGKFASVTWSAEDPSIVGIEPMVKPTQVGGVIPGAWITGRKPGLSTIEALVVARDGGMREAQPASVRVLSNKLPRGSVVVAAGTADLTFSRGQGDTELIIVEIPETGRADISVDWTRLTNRMGFFLWQGACSAIPCPGKLVVDAQVNRAKPRRETVEELKAGRYTLRAFAFGAGPETARYEIRLTPR